MIGEIRYLLGVVTVIAVPVGLLYWVIIHSCAHRFRTWRPRRTYSAILPGIAGAVIFLFAYRRQLLGADLGTNWALICIAILLAVPMTWMDFQCRKYLTFRIMTGVPEVSVTENAQLLLDGPYRIVRHPRYLSAGIGLLFNALIANYLGVYVLIVVSLPIGYIMLILEERDLVHRFGDAYQEYQRTVPRLLPAVRRGTRRSDTGQ